MNGFTIGFAAAILSFLAVHSIYLYGCRQLKPGFSRRCSGLFFPDISAPFGNLWPSLIRFVLPLLIGGLVALVYFFLSQAKTSKLEK